MTQPIDIFITTFLREEFAKECVKYLHERTIHPYRLTIIDNGGNLWAETDPRVHRYIPLWKSVGNAGIHYAWNTALSLAESEYFITSDPDLLVPDLMHTVFAIAPGQIGYSAIDVDQSSPDWLSRMIGFMDSDPKWGAISLCPHVFIGAAGIDPSGPEDVLERNMCGAVMRMMKTEAVKEVGGWEFKIEEGRNHEESWVCSRLQNAGYKTGIASRVRAYHLFGKTNWGYPEDFTPEQQKHNPALKDYVGSFDKRENYDSKTWLPK